MRISKVTAQFIVNGKTITAVVELRDGSYEKPVPACTLIKDGDRYGAANVQTEHVR